MRLIELLKQNQGSPLEVEKQIILIYAGMKGYLDSIAINQIETFKIFVLNSIDYSDILVKFDKNVAIPIVSFEYFFKQIVTNFIKI